MHKLIVLVFVDTYKDDYNQGEVAGVDDYNQGDVAGVASIFLSHRYTYCTLIVSTLEIYGDVNHSFFALRLALGLERRTAINSDAVATLILTCK